MNIIIGKSFEISLDHLSLKSKSLYMQWINPGIFIMGSPLDELGRSNSVEDQFSLTLNDGYWIGKYPITQAQWDSVIDNNPKDHDYHPDCPIVNVNWDEATLFCDQLNLKFKESLHKGYNFGLPTEAQWEYACRAGSQTMYYNGDDPNQLFEIAWFCDNSDGHVHLVGEKQPNKWNLYDMLGNVYEWCYDSITQYPDHSAQDWYGEPQHYTRSLRGGAFSHSPTTIRCANRGYLIENAKRPHIGFRLSLRELR